MHKLISYELVVAAMLAAVITPAATAAVNIANGAFVVAGSGDYPNGTFNSGVTFGTFNVTDGQNATPDNDTGIITEPSNDGGC